MIKFSVTLDNLFFDSAFLTVIIHPYMEQYKKRKWRYIKQTFIVLCSPVLIVIKIRTLRMNNFKLTSNAYT